MASWPALAKADTQGGFLARPSPIPGRVLSSAGGIHVEVKNVQDPLVLGTEPEQEAKPVLAGHQTVGKTWVEVFQDLGEPEVSVPGRMARGEWGRQ